MHRNNIRVCNGGHKSYKDTANFISSRFKTRRCGYRLGRRASSVGLCIDFSVYITSGGRDAKIRWNNSVSGNGKISAVKVDRKVGLLVVSLDIITFLDTDIALQTYV